MSRNIVLPLVFSLFFGTFVAAQNIVEYLGKEKIETTEEGSVLHLFKDGLALRGMVNPGFTFNAQDIIGWQYATGNFRSPKAGDEVEAYPVTKRHTDDDLHNENENKDWVWTAVETTDKGVIERLQTSPALYGLMPLANERGQFDKLRSTYLYTAVDVEEEQKVLLQTTGGTQTYINGILHEGDHYDFGYSLEPIVLKKGLNEFIYVPGRFGSVISKLVKPKQDILFTKRDMTYPNLLTDVTEPYWAAVRVINMTDEPLKGYTIKATLPEGETLSYKIGDILAMSTRKMKYQLPALSADSRKKYETKFAEGKSNYAKADVKIELQDASGKTVDELKYEAGVTVPSNLHNRTFVSNIDGSVQFFGVRPAERKKPDEPKKDEPKKDAPKKDEPKKDESKKGLVLTTHGAGVDAGGQASCYSQKDWVDVVAPTNRRPYGFNWEVWGRIDAFEVLNEAKRIYEPDPEKIYSTGHSMGGHGSWFMSATFPDTFAAGAPCAGYPDRTLYVTRSGDKSTRNSQQRSNLATDHPMNPVFERSANEARILSRIENLKSIGIYIFHGEEDTTVPTQIARQMREVLAKFHTNFCYYEYPGGSHWFGALCMDWNPIFEFFKRHTIPAVKNVKKIDFKISSPNVSASNFWVRIEQQVRPYDISHIVAERKDDTITVSTTDNIALLGLDIPAIEPKGENVTVKIGGKDIDVPSKKYAYFSFDGNEWKTIDGLDTKQKYSRRFGGFKETINNNVVFVYATGGNKAENDLYRKKALFDADTFYYKGNGSIDIIPDTDYSYEKYKYRNVMVYGTQDTNKAWEALLSKSPIQVKKGEVQFGTTQYTGSNLGVYFVHPHPQSETALVGVVAGTGEEGFRAAFPNNYISPGTGFPDFMIFRSAMLRNGFDGLEAAGFFDNHWGLGSRDYVLKGDPAKAPAAEEKSAEVKNPEKVSSQEETSSPVRNNRRRR
ncbi:hypothetical protein FACS189419_04110 [Planctomycetales bacterium]|nr:hypothetical protein FACS189419_04110 [Planctomycetales bacterium]